jgi:hypothetical protein
MRSEPNLLRTGAHFSWERPPFDRATRLFRCAELPFARIGGFFLGACVHFAADGVHLRCAAAIFECSDRNFECSDRNFGCSDPNFGCSDPHFECSDPIFGCSDPHCQRVDPNFECSDLVFESADPIFGRSDPIFQSAAPHIRSARPIHRSLCDRKVSPTTHVQCPSQMTPCLPRPRRRHSSLAQLSPGGTDDRLT